LTRSVTLAAESWHRSQSRLRAVGGIQVASAASSEQVTIAVAFTMRSDAPSRQTTWGAVLHVADAAGGHTGAAIGIIVAVLIGTGHTVAGTGELSE